MMQRLRTTVDSLPEGQRGERAFTFPDVMVTAAVSMLVLAGLITTYLFGFRLFEFTKPKLSASDNAREALGKFVLDLRSANCVRVGTGTGSTFTKASSGSFLQGNALQVFATTNTNSYTVYYLDTDQKLKRRKNGSGIIDIIATGISNQNSQVFTIENYAGTILTNDAYNSLIGMNLQFLQIEYPTFKIGTNRFYDSYQLRTKVIQRVWDVPTS